MVMGDVLAICLMEAKGFNADDFAKYHPGGTLGRILYLRAGDMITADDRPAVFTTDSIKSAIMEITKRRLGAAVVLEENKIAGIITDGDIRRMMENHDDFTGLTAKDVMSLMPKTAEAEIDCVMQDYQKNTDAAPCVEYHIALSRLVRCFHTLGFYRKKVRPVDPCTKSTERSRGGTMAFLLE